jgi:hypothetical protein
MRRLAGYMTRSGHWHVKMCAKKRTGQLVAPATGPYISKARRGRQNADRAANRTSIEWAITRTPSLPSCCR